MMASCVTLEPSSDVRSTSIPSLRIKHTRHRLLWTQARTLTRSAIQQCPYANAPAMTPTSNLARARICFRFGPVMAGRSHRKFHRSSFSASLPHFDSLSVFLFPSLASHQSLPHIRSLSSRSYVPFRIYPPLTASSDVIF